MSNKTSSDRPTMSRGVTKLVLWPFPRFTSKLVLEDKMAGTLTARRKVIIASVSEDEGKNGRVI